MTVRMKLLQNLRVYLLLLVVALVSYFTAGLFPTTDALRAIAASPALALCFSRCGNCFVSRRLISDNWNCRNSEEPTLRKLR